MQPVGQTIAAGVQATFTAAATGTPAPRVQWQVSTDGVDFSNIPGATGTSYSFIATEAQNGEQLQAVFTNSAGSATSTPATLAVSPVAVQGSFNPGEEPYDGVIVDSNGNLYGTTRYGGPNNDGTIFEVAKGSGNITMLASFNGANGIEPMGGLIMDRNGNLYGTAESGGPEGDGTVFELAKGSSTINTLAYFNGTNGAGPIGGVVMDSNGNLYGITSATIFELAFGSGAITTLASLGADQYPAGVSIDSAGNLYGTTQEGGANGDGSVFEWVKGSTTITTLASFDGANGGDPITGVIMDGSGNLYGTTDEGGAIGSTVSGYGTVFECVRASGTISTLASFDSSVDQFPETRLIMDNSGNLYGTTRESYAGYTLGGGAVFELANGSGKITNLATFNGSFYKAPAPDGSMAMDGSGNLYGTTWEGAAGGDGTVFEWVKGSSNVTTLASFNDLTNGGSPLAGLVMDSSGDLYGTTYRGGALQDGTVFELANGAASPTTLASLYYSDVEWPVGGLVIDSSGNLYGVATEGGSDGDGAIFELAKGNATVTVLADLDGSNGQYPEGTLIMDGSGNLYGTTLEGGANGYGTVFELAKGSSNVTALASFNGSTGYPVAGVIMDSNGNLYGTTEDTVFELAKGSSNVAALALLDGFNGVGYYPEGRLIMDRSGNLYGATYSGGSNGDGTVFEYVNGSGTIKTLASFNGGNGEYPRAGLIMDGSGNLYGTTSSGGASGDGTVFELSQGTATIVTLASFFGAYGQTPSGGLIFDDSGNLYGTASAGGAYGFGDVFEIHPAPVVTMQPASQTATEGQQVTFSAGAVGTPTPAVQWQVSTDGVNFSNVSGATGLTYTVIASTAQNGKEFRAVFTNASGNVTSNPATLTVPLVAPTVTAQPVSQTITAGQQATFTATASGTPLPTVQWQASTDNGKTWSGISGATSSTYSFAVNQTESGEKFEAVFTNSLASATSDPAMLTVQTAPALTTQPTSQTIFAGQQVIFTAAASGAPTPTVQWQVSTDGVNFNSIPGATRSSYTFTTTQAESGEQFQAVFSNRAGSVTSTAATLAVQTAPFVTTQPNSEAVTAAQQVTFTAAAGGTPTPTVQWRVSTDGVNFTNVIGASGTSYSFTASQAQNGEELQAVFTNAAGSATSIPATLTVQSAPIVAIQPVSQAMIAGQEVTFTAAASGTPPPAVQWQVSTDGVHFTNITAATNGSYSFTVSEADRGEEFQAVFTNVAGSVTSNPATLTLQAAPAVTVQPASQTITADQPVTFTASATGTPLPTVQWQVSFDGVNFSDIAGAIGATYSSTVSQSESGEEFQAVFTNSAGSATSKPATLTVQTAPAVTTQPTSQTTLAGRPVTFTAAASGTPTPAVQWQVSTDGVDFNNIPGATGASYTFTASQAQSGEQFEAVFSNGAGNSISNVATLTVQTAPVIATQPTSQAIAAGRQATFIVAAGGTPTPTVQWQVSTNVVNFTNITGATSTSYTVTATQAQSGEQFQAVFTNAAGSVTSDPATLTVPTAPAVTTQPSSQTITGGQQVTFTAAASGAPTPTLQWQVSTDGVSFTNITAATSASYSFTASQADSGEEFQAVFTNSAGSATSDPATLTVQTAPAVTTQPVNQTINFGQQVTFTAAASGTPPPAVQWQMSTDGVHYTPIAGTTNTNYSFAVNQWLNGAQFEAVFANPAGTATSSPATLTLQSAPVIGIQPVSQTIIAGRQVTFATAAGAVPIPTVQWQMSTDGTNFGNIAGAASPNFSFTVSQAQSGEQFRAVFTNAAGSATSNPATLTVQTVPVITWSNPPGITYGTALSSTIQLDASASVLGTYSYTLADGTTPAVGAVLNAGQGQILNVTFTPNDTTDYTTTTAQVEINVSPAALTVTGSGTQVYGGSPVFAAAYSGFVLGQDSSVLGGTLAFATTTSSSSNAGTYHNAVTPSGLTSSNYRISFDAGDMVVTRAALTVTANDQTMIYGGPLPALTVTYSELVNGDTPATFNSSPNAAPTVTAPTTNHVGSYSRAIVASGAVDADYTITYVPGKLTVTPAELTITANDQTMVYGGALPAVTVAYSGLVNGDTPATFGSSPNAAPTVTAPATNHVGSYSGAIVASGAVDTDYAITYVAGTLSVTPAPLTITADDKSKVYGAALPALTATYSGFVNGDTTGSLTVPPSLSTTATASSHVSGSPYTTTASGAVDADYTISYVAGALTVTPAPLTITAGDKSKVYGAAPPALTASYTGFINGDSAASLTTPPSLSTTATAGSHVSGSPYAITASGAVDADYTIGYVAGLLTVTPAALTITADDKSKVYGADLPTLTATYSGFVNGDTAGSLTTPPTLSTSATASSHVSGSPYAITASGAVDADYTISYVPGKLTVTPATLTVQANDASKIQGAANPIFTDTTSGFVNGDDSGVVSGAARLSTTATTTSPVGTYPITAAVGTLAAADYTFAFQNGTLTVTAATTFVATDAVYTIGSGTVSVSAANGLLANDTGPSLAVTAGTATGAQGGTFTFRSDGSFTYMPGANFPGYDSAPFTVSDASGDSAAHTVTVLSQHAGVVWKFYESVLNRVPDPAGLQYWTNYFNTGGNTGDMAFGFFESDELLDKVLGNYYQQYLLRPLDANGLTYWKGIWHATGGPEEIKAGFADSPEFYNSAGGTPQSWLTALYQRILSRTPDPAGEMFWMNYYQQQTAAGVDAGTVLDNIALGFFDSAEAFGNDVTGWFQEYLFRAPTDAEKAQYASQMEAGATDRTIEQAITNLPEYGNEPPAPAAGGAAALADYYQTSAQSQAVVAAKDALFASL